jgi:LysM repeat protein
MFAKDRRPSLISLGLLVVLLGLFVLPAIVQADNNPPDGYYYYTVRQGDTWSIVSQRTGVSAAELKRLNPQAIHPKGWLWVGERLQVPGKAPAIVGYWYQVKPGDTWKTVAKATGVPIKELWAANPRLLNRQLWLYLGQRVWVPAAPPLTPAAIAAVGTVTPTPPALAASTPAAAAAQPGATPVAPVPTAAPTALAAAPDATPAPTAAGARAKPGAPGCPETFAGYPDAISSRLSMRGKSLADLQAWLVACGVLAEGDSGVTPAALQSPNSTDVVVAIVDPASQEPEVKGALLVYHANPEGGYTLARTINGKGLVTLLRADDINADGKSDLVWTDTTCGAAACFSTLFVESWDGTEYKPWITGDPTIANAEYAFQDVSAAGSGDEILIHGGVLEAPNAGPQRAWTETYASLNGAPYSLVSQTYDKSTCLYHAIQDANALLGAWATGGFDPVIAAYQAAISDPKLTACWTVKDEVSLLKDFARFKLLVGYVAGGQSSKAAAIAGQIGQPALKGAGEVFLKSYKASGSVIQACRDTTAYAVANPAAWQFLADWGPANPTFAPEDLCPLK